MEAEIKAKSKSKKGDNQMGKKFRKLKTKRVLFRIKHYTIIMDYIALTLHSTFVHPSSLINQITRIFIFT